MSGNAATRHGTGVSIAGIGITPHGFFPHRSWRDLVVESAYAAIEDAGVDPHDVDAGMVSVTMPETFEQQNLGALTADELGLAPSGFGQVVAACAGGMAALQAGVNMIASGRHRCVLVVGIEKPSDVATPAEPMLMYVDSDFEGPAGFDHGDGMALMHARYMDRYGASAEAIAQFAVQDRWYASRNPNALDCGRPELTCLDVLASPPVSYPITRAACSRACDASSAVVLMPTADARAAAPHRSIGIAGIAQATGPNTLAAKFGHPGYAGIDIVVAEPTSVAAHRAFSEARLDPGDVQLAQVHDCFTIMGLLHLEGLGLLPQGRAWAAVADGVTAIDGRLPTNTDGGRIGLGHPTGTTGINTVVEAASQMRGTAGARQVTNAEVSVCQSMGGHNSTSAVVLLTS